GTNSMSWAKIVLPTFMSNSRNSQISEGTQKCEFSVQIGTKKNRLLSRANTGFIPKIYSFNRTAVMVIIV
ncbi:MAG: hypothetical protein LRY49_05975, partial [Burkholderiaceae bacterium]|nr:hypothetical protein [Burkholderiaceae bacterium]